jgi:hypothetical protein
MTEPEKLSETAEFTNWLKEAVERIEAMEDEDES